MVDLKDFIYTTHKAGNRLPQRVKKYKTICDGCGRDRGYIFKSREPLCSSCSHKKSYSNGKALAPNDLGLRMVFKTLTQGEIELKSSYEVFYYTYLKRIKIKCLYESKRFDLSNGQTYTPDFYIPSEDLYVEIKGLFREADEVKLNKFKSEYPDINLKVLFHDDLVSMGFNPAKLKKTVHLVLLGTRWKVFFMDFKQYLRTCGDGSAAITDIAKKVIYLNIRDCTIDTIRHELGHAYAATLSLTELQLDEDQVEEFFCELIGKYSKQLVKQADNIYKTFKYLKLLTL